MFSPFFVVMSCHRSQNAAWHTHMMAACPLTCSPHCPGLNRQSAAHDSRRQRYPLCARCRLSWTCPFCEKIAENDDIASVQGVASIQFATSILSSSWIALATKGSPGTVSSFPRVQEEHVASSESPLQQEIRRQERVIREGRCWHTFSAQDYPRRAKRP